MSILFANIEKGGQSVEERKEEVFEKYDLVIRSVHRTRGAFLLDTNKGMKLFKNFHGTKNKLEFEHKIKEGLKKNGFGCIDNFVINKEGEIISSDSKGQQYIVKDWFVGEECNLKETEQVKGAAKCLGELHKHMQGITLDEPREYSPVYQLNNIFEKHNRELKRVRSYIRDKKQRNSFEIRFLTAFEDFYGQALAATELLQEPFYMDLTREAVELQKLCHGSYNYHNVLFTKDGTVVTNFDKVEIGIQAHDLYSFLRKVMEKNNWKLSYAYAVFEGYQEACPIRKEEYQLLYTLLLYPEKFWKVTNYYFNSKKSWISEKNTEKLRRILDQKQQKALFLKEIKRFTNI